MRFLKLASAAMALAMATTSFTTSAEAKSRYYRHHHGGHGGAAAATIFGFAAGAVLGSALSQPRYRYYEPAPVYVAPPPRAYYYETAPVEYGRPAPWTPEWYAYCDDRYVSFDRRTGHFLGYDGEYHFCR